jgi:hypothetical protein
MKRILLGVFAAVLLCGCHSGTHRQDYTFDAELTWYCQEWIQAGEEAITLQKNLARWYNWNLREYEDGAFREKYDEILFYSDGILGSVEAGGLHLPVYHGPGTRQGFIHDPESAFPMGQKGDHPVLITTAELQLEVAEQFAIHILDEVYVYEVLAVREDPDTSCVPGVDYCSLIQKDGTQYLGIRRTEDGELGTNPRFG